MWRAFASAGVACLLAALAPAVPASERASRSTTLTRFVAPPDGQTYFGLTFLLFDTNDPIWGDTRPFAVRIQDSIRNELAGKTPAFIKVWTPWQRPDQPGKPLVPFAEALADVKRVEGVVGDRGVVQLDWNLTTTTQTNGGITTREIASGALDGYIRRYARDVKLYGRPLLVTLFIGEFNGDWWYAVSPRANPSLTTDDFVRAWRRVVDIFNDVGAQNVSWSWNVNGYPADPADQPQIDRNIAAYYPGDAYVDWVGVDFYDAGDPAWVDAPYAFAVAHGKPVTIAEFGIRHEWSRLTAAPAEWRAWLERAFDYFESHPAIKAISYFNLCNRSGATRAPWDPSRAYYRGDGVNYVPNVNDHDHRLVAGGPEVQATFARRIAAPRYVSSVATQSLEAKWQAPIVAATDSTNVTKHTATLTATVDPGDSPTTVTFEYGRSTTYGSTTRPPSIDGVGQGPVSVTAELEGLPSGTTLHYRAVAENLGGTASGADEALTTARNRAPTVRALAARGRLGRPVRLAFVASDDDGSLHAKVWIYSRSKVIKTLAADSAPAGTHWRLEVSWRAPKTQQGTPGRRFCVRVFDGDGAGSAPSCAAITLQ